VTTQWHYQQRPTYIAHSTGEIIPIPICSTLVNSSGDVRFVDRPVSSKWNHD
jgi:hypothetical protein